MPAGLLELLQRHLTLLDYIKFFSLYIEDLTGTDKVDTIEEQMDNRARLINLTSETQAEILNQIKALDLSRDLAMAEIIHAWSQDTTWSIQKIDQIDRTIQLNLEELKSRTTKQISHLFRSRESFKGYNLTSTKR